MASLIESEEERQEADRLRRRVAIASIALPFFTVPHVLEDFALGEPQARGVPAPLIAAVVSALLSAQALALYWLGRGHARALWMHAVLGVLWPVAAGLAQLPAIFGPDPYRSGAISVAYVLGILIVGPLLMLFSVTALRARAR